MFKQSRMETGVFPLQDLVACFLFNKHPDGTGGVYNFYYGRAQYRHGEHVVEMPHNTDDFSQTTDGQMWRVKAEVWNVWSSLRCYLCNRTLPLASLFNKSRMFLFFWHTMAKIMIFYKSFSTSYVCLACLPSSSNYIYIYISVFPYTFCSQCQKNTQKRQSTKEKFKHSARKYVCIK